MALFFDLLPMMVGASLAPLWIVLVLLILQSQNGLVKAIAFILGITLVRLLQGVAFGLVLTRTPSTVALSSDEGAHQPSRNSYGHRG